MTQLTGEPDSAIATKFKSFVEQMAIDEPSEHNQDLGVNRVGRYAVSDVGIIPVDRVDFDVCGFTDEDRMHSITLFFMDVAEKEIVHGMGGFTVFAADACLDLEEARAENYAAHVLKRLSDLGDQGKLVIQPQPVATTA